MQSKYWIALFAIALVALLFSPAKADALPKRATVEFFNCVAHNKQRYISCSYRLKTEAGWYTHFKGVCPEIIFIQDAQHKWVRPESSSVRYNTGESS